MDAIDAYFADLISKSKILNFLIGETVASNGDKVAR